mmetsp:Transcript_11704/g.17784  ORF Transcript_11704/g.17784 Transcript_11704/m.17784 type:complete len:80 (+) Transcript_11704:1889-2128(+)
MCQSLFYGLPEKQRQVFFSYPEPATQTKCPGEVVFNEFFKIRIEGKRHLIYSVSSKLSSGLKSGLYSQFKVYNGWQNNF